MELVHARGALLFLDAIQGLGVFPLDVRRTPVDFLAADGRDIGIDDAENDFAVFVFQSADDIADRSGFRQFLEKPILLFFIDIEIADFFLFQFRDGIA